MGLMKSIPGDNETTVHYEISNGLRKKNETCAPMLKRLLNLSLTDKRLTLTIVELVMIFSKFVSKFSCLTDVKIIFSTFTLVSEMSVKGFNFSLVFVRPINI